ncbi:MAG: MCE family protein [Candidatus Dormibacteraeota bacterium]|nr:MCE family protein [Candidatus Dormibacteraeota bacterium]
MPSTRVKQNLFFIAIFTVFSMSGLLWLAINTGQRFGPLPPVYTVSFQVRDADGLVDGDDVRIAGIPVGKVLYVRTSPEGAMVTMGIDRAKGYDPIYTDATVLIRPKSLLGEKYVDMQRGTSNVEVADGGAIPRSQAASQVEVDQVLNNSDPATRKALSADFQALGEGVAGRGPDVNATLPELQKIAEHLSNVSSRFKDRSAQIDHILVDTDTILSTLADEHDQLAQLLQSADAVTGTIATNDQHLAGILQGGSNTFMRLNVAYAQQNNDQNIRVATQTAPPVLKRTITFLDLISPKLQTLVPSLLLGQQYNYPNDQLTVAQQYGIQLAQAWDSGFRMYAPSPNFADHGFTAISLTCKDSTFPPNPQTFDPSASYKCPGTYEKPAGGYGQAPASANGSSASTAPGSSAAAAPQASAQPQGAPAVPSVDAQKQLLEYLLGQ